MLDALSLQRAAHYLHVRGVPLVPRVLKRAILHLYGSVLDPETEFGEGTVLGYGGLNMVIHPEARLGRRVLISHGVTIGGRAGMPGLPVIEDDVKIGAGAKILGPVRIGRGALIGANAVVVHDVRPNAVAVGIPAREVPSRGRVVEAADDPEVASVTNEFRH
ncbi:serine O-acetyltransferase [Anaeromyxobacter paludicola]|uniref:Serine acetyltransferase n=1 Tax=Anaeromyxobacter paludicola TaxID=2918171 RepID=A0ABN6N2F0_9BACT|nr:DapH/DapD/GlmU-related protein [Anaeromyxobacter paludicola]BDG07111.1 serine acetyltransferase [Anaeromyxobacter paludicola]